MTQEEKQLLLKDICARLPYGVKAITKTHKGENVGKIISVSTKNNIILGELYNGKECFWLDYGSFKPYLRPMSSMAEEELNECVCQSGIKDIECPNWQDIPKEKQFEARLNHAIAVFLTDSNNVDWLNSHHFDYRGLISMGLALEALEGMYQ